MSSDTPTAPPVSTLPPGKPGIPQGLYAMWRCVICIAHADGIIQPEERTYLEKIFANLDRVYGLTPTQKITLSSDLEVPQNLADLLTKVREPEYRSMLIYFGTLLANADGTVTEDEDKLLSMLHAQQMDSLDADQLREDIRLDIEKRSWKAKPRPCGQTPAAIARSSKRSTSCLARSVSTSWANGHHPLRP